VHGVAFSPSGDCLAFASHDSTINVVYPAGPDQPPAAFYTIRSESLPYMALTFLSDDTFVAVGHDCQPVLFQGNGQQGWKAGRSLDEPSARASAAPSASRTFGGVGRLNNEAFNRFKQADSRGVGAVPSAALGSDSPPGSPVSRQNATERMTVHQNTITCVRPYAGQPGHVSQVSTSGVDGKLVIWKV
jgi:actin related protein 2/3 complex subunit 1A/1B